MDEKVKRLLKVYSELEWKDRKAVRDFIEEYEQNILERSTLRESLNKSLGPLMTNTCPYCGK